MPRISVGSDLYIFTGQQAANVNANAIIWAHGRQTQPADPFTAPGKTIHFYIQDDYEMAFRKGGVPDTFGRFIRQEVLPVDTYMPGAQGVPNYTLQKAAEGHIGDADLQMQYNELQAIANGQNFDIVSVRNRVFSHGTTLKSLVAATNYQFYHGIFCRAWSNGRSLGLRAPQPRTGRTTIYT